MKGERGRGRRGGNIQYPISKADPTDPPDPTNLANSRQEISGGTTSVSSGIGCQPSTMNHHLRRLGSARLPAVEIKCGAGALGGHHGGAERKVGRAAGPEIGAFVGLELAEQYGGGGTDRQIIMA